MIARFKFAAELLQWGAGDYPEGAKPPTPDICYDWFTLTDQEPENWNNDFERVAKGKDVVWAVDEMASRPPVVIYGAALIGALASQPESSLKQVAFVIDFANDLDMRLLLDITKVCLGHHEWPEGTLPKDAVYAIFDELEERAVEIVDDDRHYPVWLDQAKLDKSRHRFLWRWRSRIEDAKPNEVADGLRRALATVQKLKRKASSVTPIRRLCLTAEAHLKRMIEVAPK